MSSADAEKLPLLNTPEGSSCSEADTDEVEFEPDAQAYGVERDRYLVLAGLALVNASNAMLWMTFATVVQPTKEFYDITSSDINTLSIVYMIIYSVAFWLSGMLLPKIGLGWGLVLGASLNVAVCTVRLATIWFVRSYAMLLTGNFIGGICQVLILSAPPMLANQWFGLEERALATGVGVAAQIFGGSLGAVLPSNIVTEADADQFATLFYALFGFASLGLMVTLVAKKSPSLPPTPAAFKFDERATRRSYTHQHVSVTPTIASINAHPHPGLLRYLKRAIKDIFITIKAILTNKPFMLLLVVSGIGQGSVWTLGSLMLQIVQPFGVSQMSIGWIGLGGQVAGGTSSILVGRALSRFQDYRTVLLGLSIGAAVSVMPFPTVAVIMDGHDSPVSAPVATALTAVLYVGLCVCSVSQCPIIFELGVEMSFPLSEEITSPIIMWTPSVLSLAMIQLLGYFLTDNPTRERGAYTFFIVGGLMLVSVMAIWLLRPSYNRRDYELGHDAKVRASVAGIPVIK